jgi:uncharacterized membrane protein YeiH
MEVLGYWIGMAATVAFAVTAVLAVSGRGMDLFGALVLGIITAVGGGTVRDVILDVPVFWAAELAYIWVAIGASVAAYVARPLFTSRQIYGLMLYLDGFGAALFGIEATDKVWKLGFGLPVAPVMLGVITAIGGGLIRDVLAGRETLLMKREIYAVPVLVGCALFVLVLTYVPEYRLVGALGCILFVFALRAAAIHWNLTVPYWFTTKPKTE